MRFGDIFLKALQRAELPYDADHMDLARGFANDNIEELWYKVKADYRVQEGKTLSMVSSTSEYALDKLHHKFVKNSVQGPVANPRILAFKDKQSYARKTAGGLDVTGYPYLFTYGELRGFDTQLGSASVIDVASSLANVTTGTCAFTAGSTIVTSSSSVFTLNHVGLRIKKSGDSLAYKIIKYYSSSKVEIESKYRGDSDATANYTLGDIDIPVVISGVVSGEVQSETVLLNGTTIVTTTKSFTTVTGIAKGDFSGGIITVSNNDQSTTVGTLAPGELDLERQTVKVWPIPSATETITYAQYRKHPRLRIDNDKLLLPEWFHKLVLYMTTRDLIEWDDRQASAFLVDKINAGMMELVNDANETGQEALIPRDEGSSGFGDQYYYDHDEDFG